MIKFVFSVFLSVLFIQLNAQAPKKYSSSDILNSINRLPVYGSVLYVAAHPDDENTRLLAWLANEKHYRTGYLSITRGDGGQNLIGDEQGIDLGLIRTQELLAARRIDGAEQFFTRAYDFGYSKSPDETLKIWGHVKILSDVVWVIRKFRPDVIITRFPTTGEGGHGHHTASAILASEAFDAAADSTKFPEHFKHGVTAWKAKRLLWNTFNFGGNNTTREDQLKIDVGAFNAILGKSYGEIAAESRSQHKSQGFGVPSQRGEIFEYFSLLKGEKPLQGLMDGVNVSSARAGAKALDTFSNKTFDPEKPHSFLPYLVKMYQAIILLEDGYWKTQKLLETSRLIEAVSGVFLDATTNSPYAVRGDSIKISVVVNNRSGAGIKNARVDYEEANSTFPVLEKNKNNTVVLSSRVASGARLTQPYWLEKEMNHGSFNVPDQKDIGKAENEPLSVSFFLDVEGVNIKFTRPIRYKFTDPVKGELYQPLTIVPALSLHVYPSTVIAGDANTKLAFTKNYRLFVPGSSLKKEQENFALLFGLQAGNQYAMRTVLDAGMRTGLQNNGIVFKDQDGNDYVDLREINYDHIPSIRYFKPSRLNVVSANAQIIGSRIGYIAGAGDQVPQALEQMGYAVTMLTEKDINAQTLNSFDAVVTGVRAYNVHPWLSNAYPLLMQYVKDGGVLVSQYNTNNSIGPVKANISPYPFVISRNRITDENAPVTFLEPAHPVLNSPNKITQKDFEGWVQERSIYHAENIDSNYRRILRMNDPGEASHDGSLIVADYGKGRFVYTGLVFFRQLPAGVPGAYRLFANLVASNRPPAKKSAGNTKQPVPSLKQGVQSNKQRQ